MNKGPIRVLLVEDNPGDVTLTRKMLAGSRVLSEVEVAADGEKALARLSAPQALPDIILLDLNMPRMGGLEFLERMKKEDALRSIPVVVLSTSQSDTDVRGSYTRYANCYVSKPLDAAGYRLVMRAIEDFWFATAKLPRA